MCDPEAANAVAGQVKNLTRQALADHPNVKHIIVIGNDEMTPFLRLPDITETGNGRIMPSRPSSIRIRPCSPRFVRGYMLSDDFYADLEPSQYSGLPLYVANYGRAASSRPPPKSRG